MQRATLRRRCHARSGEMPAAREVCERLRRDDFRPAMPADKTHVYTNHLWVHTWIPGAEKVALDDTVPASE